MPSCGYRGLGERPYDEHGCASYEICPCCGTEFGYDDASAPHPYLRQRWIEAGMPWWSKAVSPPADFDPLKQLSDILAR